MVLNSIYHHSAVMSIGIVSYDHMMFLIFNAFMKNVINVLKKKEHFLSSSRAKFLISWHIVNSPYKFV